MLPNLSRRQFMVAGGATAVAAAVAQRAEIGRQLLGPVSSREKLVQAGAAFNFPNMAPAADQFFVDYRNPTGSVYKCFDLAESVYARAPLADNFSTPLVRITNAYKFVPGVAHAWKQTSPTTWEFYITPGIMWTDGNELTANDFVETIRYAGDPKHAWDFAWFWGTVGIKNFADAVAGKAPLDTIGVAVGKDKYTFVVTTETPVAFVPQAMIYSMPLSAAGLAKYGNGLYNTNPATCISMGPYVLKSFNPTTDVVLNPNPKYSAGFNSPIQWQIAKISTSPYLPLLATGAVDENSDIAMNKNDLAIAKATPRIGKLTPYINPIDFRVYYVFFKCHAAPFNNVLVRQAFAHALDRDSIIKGLLAPLAIPAYGFLEPGFPFSVTEPLKKYQDYDPDLAQRLLARAGYPKGKGFPEVTFSYPSNVGAIGPETTPSVVDAIAYNYNQVLFDGGTTILQQAMDIPTFYTKMTVTPTHKTEIEMGFISYGMDYFDGSNMLSIYTSAGRHDWDDKTYDALWAQGGEVADVAKRQEIYTEAQIRLSSQAPAAFAFFGLGAYMMWPYVQGPTLAKNYLGYDGIQWPGYYPHSTNQQGLYIANDVGQYPRQGESSYLS
jgi:ABC-type transport system substrate-binding protein